ncbi:MAG TPA: peptidylprolyl isomerase [Thermoleophilaceae bacterium]|nr:peptidylprolyl isomerase [Thermoleophilaceae bacterium]
MIRSLTALIALLALLFLAACGDDDSDSGNGSGGGASAQTDTAAQDDQQCARVDAPKAKPDGGATKPKGKLDPAKTHTVTFQTSCGDFTVTLDVEGAPNTAASFAALARSGFYDDTVFHRIVPGFVIQGGDPTGTGTGGPGYKTVDKPPANASYTRGVVSMAKTAAEAPGTAGSQFYVVTGADAGLPPDYAIVGEVTDGMDAVMRIEALGDPSGSEQPTRPVVIEKATVSASAAGR